MGGIRRDPRRIGICAKTCRNASDIPKDSVQTVKIAGIAQSLYVCARSGCGSQQDGGRSSAVREIILVCSSLFTPDTVSPSVLRSCFNLSTVKVFAWAAICCAWSYAGI